MPDVPSVAVAFSGGRDSLALLHATCRSAERLGLRVVALHVHHGLLPEADAWVRHAQALCRRWASRGWPLRLRVAWLAGGPGPGQSIEAWARKGRHAALARLAGEEGAGLLLLAHHRQDQAETVLLQALRSAGTAGLSAMPHQQRRGDITWARPWLDQPRRAIDGYVARHRLRPQEDPSNQDPRLARSRLRAQAWPALVLAFADAEAALAGVAQRAQQADAALAELAALDLAPLRRRPTLTRAGPSDRSGLDVAGWLALSDARRANALWAWLGEMPGGIPSQSLVQRLLRELPATRSACWPAGGGVAGLVLHRACLHWVAVLDVHLQRHMHRHRRPGRAAPGCTACGQQPSADDAGGMVRNADGLDAASGGPSRAWLDLSQPGSYHVPGWPGELQVATASARGVAAAELQAVQLVARNGGERFALTPNGQARSLKKQYQARGLSAAERNGPLLRDAAGRLLWASGLGVDARCWAPDGTTQRVLHWLAPSACSDRS